MANEEKEMYELAEKYGYTIEKEYCFDMDYKYCYFTENDINNRSVFTHKYAIIKNNKKLYDYVYSVDDVISYIKQNEVSEKLRELCNQADDIDVKIREYKRDFKRMNDTYQELKELCSDSKAIMSLCWKSKSEYSEAEKQYDEYFETYKNLFDCMNKRERSKYIIKLYKNYYRNAINCYHALKIDRRKIFDKIRDLKA